VARGEEAAHEQTGNPSIAGMRVKPEEKPSVRSGVRQILGRRYRLELEIECE
jgi:hypothetical protein